MKKRIIFKQKIIEYELVYKRVKNINLRIRPGGEIMVSANKRLPEALIDAFVLSRAEWILSILEKQERQTALPLQRFFTEEALKERILSLCREIYPYYEAKGIAFPEIKFRKMVSCWGNCRSGKGVITFSLNLVYASPACVDYVVRHEFTHLLEPNHSKAFYRELEKVCPDWPERRKELKSVILPRT